MITLENFEKNYYKAGINGRDFHDIFRASIHVLPFTSNPSTSTYDKSCGLCGITGEFFRKCKDTGTEAIVDFQKNAVDPVLQHLVEDRNMKQQQADRFVEIMKDILYADGALSIIDTSFLKFIPLCYEEGTKMKKYRDGQRKMADYLASMLTPKDLLINFLSRQSNLFNNLIMEALESNGVGNDEPNSEFYILPFIRQTFGEDMHWLLKKEDHIVVKYIHLFLHFYLCYSVTQTLICLNPNRYENIMQAPEKFYFILTSEHASHACEAVVKGWSKHITTEVQEKLFGRLQALDIMNGMLGNNVGNFNDVYNEFCSIPFTSEVKSLLEEVLRRYQEDKKIQLQSRETLKMVIPDDINITVNDYGEFISKLSLLCTSLQSKEYDTKMKSRIMGLMKVRLLSTRKEHNVLALDDEMLFFLIAMVTKGQRTKLEDMYKAFSKYGICFNLGTRAAIEEYLLKLNLLDRKSDSGEAQYVEIIL